MKYVAAFIGILLLLAIAGLGTSWFGLVTSRPMAKYSKETERQVYLNSVAHQQGAMAGLAIDCSNMRNASTPAPQRHAFASLVIQDAVAYAGDQSLPSDGRVCVREANDLLAVALG
jgi:hypothetical protein